MKGPGQKNPAPCSRDTDHQDWKGPEGDHLLTSGQKNIQQKTPQVPDHQLQVFATPVCGRFSAHSTLVSTVTTHLRAKENRCSYFCCAVMFHVLEGCYLLPLSSFLQIATQIFGHFFTAFASPLLLLSSWLSVIGPYLSWNVLMKDELVLQRGPHESCAAQKITESFLLLLSSLSNPFHLLVCHGRCVVVNCTWCKRKNSHTSRGI